MVAETERVALVTGASSGIGEAAAHELLAAGFTVYGTSHEHLPQVSSLQIVSPSQ